MATKDLIDAALAKKTAKDTTAAAVVTATSNDTQAGTDLTAADQAVHDDLTANGQALYVSTDSPPVYSVATAVDPGSFALTTIRVA